MTDSPSINRVQRFPTPGSPTLARAAAISLVLAVAAACSPAAAGPTASPGSGGQTPGASGAPGGSPSGAPGTPAGTPSTGAIEHPTGPKDIVLRFEESGGFVPIEHSATYAPSFTLYGDGTLVFRDPWAPAPEPVNNVTRAVPFQVLKLGEDAIQALLEDALGRGGLAIAKGPYHGMGADIPTSTFTISAGGQTKQVSVTGLSPEMHPQNAAVVTSLAGLAERWRAFGDDIAGEQPYRPERYRGILIKVDQPFGPVIQWPWEDLDPSDFEAGANEFFLTRALTAAEVGSLGIPDVEGGLLGVATQKDGQVYTFALRPLLPEETE